MPATRQTKFVHDGTSITVNETILPTSFAHFVHAGPTDNYARDLAVDIYQVGSGRFEWEGTRVSPCDYRLDVTIDMSKNSRFVRDCNIAYLASRLGAFIGAGGRPANVTAQAAEAGGIGGDQYVHDKQPPKTWPGDAFRMGGNLLGLGVDYVIFAVYWFCGKVADLFR